MTDRRPTDTSSNIGPGGSGFLGGSSSSSSNTITGGLNSGSDLRHSLLKSRLAKLPHLPAIAPEPASGGSGSWHAQLGSDKDASLQDGTSGNHAGNRSMDEEELEGADALGPMGMMPPPSGPANRLSSKLQATPDLFSPLSSSDCFAEALEVDVGEGSGARAKDVRPATVRSGAQELTQYAQSSSSATFRVYYTPSKGSARQNVLSASQDAGASLPRKQGWDSEDLLGIQLPTVDESNDNSSAQTKRVAQESAGTVFLLHHGAGYSALSFALVAEHITKSSNGAAGVLAYDCRGHGRTRHSSEEASQDLSLATLTNDALAVLARLFPPEGPQPTLVLVGHSMGGSVVVSLAHALANDVGNHATRPRVSGVAVLDVVEGTAMAALPSMKSIVSSLPTGFASIEEAIQWHVDSGTIVNLDSARRSVPSLLKRSSTHLQSREDERVDEVSQEDEPVEELRSPDREDERLAPPTDPAQANNTTRRDSSQHAYVWRHNLLASEPHWQGWFAGLSQRFLSCKCARLLLLAGTDRLDKELMIGQMQGKFQMNVFVDVGHSLQEVSKHVAGQENKRVPIMLTPRCSHDVP